MIDGCAVDSGADEVQKHIYPPEVDYVLVMLDYGHRPGKQQICEDCGTRKPMDVYLQELKVTIVQWLDPSHYHIVQSGPIHKHYDGLQGQCEFQTHHCKHSDESLTFLFHAGVDSHGAAHHSEVRTPVRKVEDVCCAFELESGKDEETQAP